MRLPPACTDRGSACSGRTHRFALRVWLPLDILAGLWTADSPRFPVSEKAGIQKCTPKPSADTNQKERPFGFPVLGGLDYGAYAIRPYAFDRKKD